MNSILRKIDHEASLMERIISPGEKIEMRSVEEVEQADGTKEYKVYQTQVFDIAENGNLEIMMPMEKTKLILLPVEGEYETFFFTSSGMYQGVIRIVDREKRDNAYILIAELITTLSKFQRREFYRFNTVIEALTKTMSDTEIHAVEQKLYHLIPTNELKRSVVVDISGGGCRFLSKQHYEKDSIIYLKFDLPINGQPRVLNLAAKVIMSRDIAKRPGEVETRVKFVFINNTTREDIIKYIFDEDRKNRKNGKR